MRELIKQESQLMHGGYALLTAEILYQMPDHKSLLQSFIWQDYDFVPQFPRLLKFLNFWKQELDGPLHSVTVAHHLLVPDSELRHRNSELIFH